MADEGDAQIASVEDFDAPLQPYGEWVVVGSYGRCWRPSRVEANWRPYCDGHWQRTDAGWYWASDEPWGWATYHYGRWDLEPGYGWIWVPHTRWAPAWVAWRSGGGYVGWAPLPPSARFGHGHDIRNVNASDRSFVFVHEGHFNERVRPTTVVINNTTVIHNTVNITNITVTNNRVRNEGPRVDVIERASGRTIQAQPVRQLRRQNEAQVVANHPVLAHPHAAPPVRTSATRNGPIAPAVNRPAPGAAQANHNDFAPHPTLHPLNHENAQNPYQAKPTLKPLDTGRGNVSVVHPSEATHISPVARPSTTVHPSEDVPHERRNVTPTHGPTTSIPHQERVVSPPQGQMHPPTVVPPAATHREPETVTRPAQAPPRVMATPHPRAVERPRPAPPASKDPAQDQNPAR